MRIARTIISGLGIMALLWFPSSASAYIGPGAGFAFLSSFLFVVVAALIAFLLIFTLPARLLIRALRSRKRSAPASVNRLIIVGLDGLDPELAAGFMEEGKLPHLSALRAEGHFSPLQTSNPPISPVAWSSFMTGTNPGKHNIFDFLRRDPRTYLPALSSAEIGTSGRAVKLGKFKISPPKPRIKLLRKSTPFWKILGEHGIFSIILKVPITFPPEKFKGLLLSGLCTPDLKGSQGTFSFYTTRKLSDEHLTSGTYYRLEGPGPTYSAFISGPAHPFREGEILKIPLKITPRREEETAMVEIGGQRHLISRGVLSPWIPLQFKAGWKTRIRGIAQLYLKSTSPELELYLSPVQIDPAKPALPISHPLIYSMYLSKLFDSFATLGLPQDTWALNERVLTDDGFLQQTYGVHEKLEEIFFHSLGQLRKGMLCCVFDTSDVIQHEFWRYREKDHPALKASDSPRPEVIEELYRKLDGLIGRVRARLQPDDLLLVVSDHGFKLFSRGVNINTWLYQNGYLCLEEGKSTSGEWLKGVDWSKTKAYALGLSGLYLNRQGREKHGILGTEEAEKIKADLVRKLTGLRDEANGGQEAISTLYDTDRIYQGPYKDNAPDLIVGYFPGYRASWESVTGTVTGAVFSDNEKAWSADHCIDHRFVPGVFFSSRPVDTDNLSIQDLAPTALNLFGIAPPAYMDGKIIKFIND